MRRLGRWMLNALTALSLLLCVGTCVLWARSYWALERVVWIPRQVGYTFDSERGHFAFRWEAEYPAGYRHPQEWRYEQVPAERLADGSIYGDDADDTNRGYVIRWGREWAGDRHRPSGIVLVPFWVIAACASIPLTLSGARKLVRQSRPHAGRCGKCDYDLTGNVSGVCPECGIKIAPKAGAV